MTLGVWCSDDDLADALSGVSFTIPMARRARVLATETLYGLSGRRWPGEQTALDRPLGGPACSCYLQRGVTSLCPRVRQQRLIGSPLVSITRVKIDGEVIDPSRYRIDDGLWLTAVQATADAEPLWWPSCQRIDLPDTEPGTWSVEYTYGSLPPEGGRIAASVLAAELLLAWLPETDDGPSCRLPSTWTAITRAGIQITRAGAEAMATLGMTGLPEVDLWLTSLRKGAMAGATAYRPGKAPVVRRPPQPVELQPEQGPVLSRFTMRVMRGDSLRFRMRYWLDTEETDPWLTVGDFDPVVQFRRSTSDDVVLVPAESTDGNEVTYLLTAEQSAGLDVAGYLWDTQLTDPDADPGEGSMTTPPAGYPRNVLIVTGDVSRSS